MRKMENWARIRDLPRAKERNGSDVGRTIGSLKKASLID